MEQQITLWTTVATLLAIVVGFSLTIWSNSRLIRAQVVSVNRQHWINRLRELTADVIATCGHIRLLEGVDSLREHMESPPPPLDYPRLRELELQFMRSRNEIALMLNGNEPAQQTLLKLIPDMDYRKNGFDYGIASERFGEAVRDVLKTEWDRVKAGK